MKIALKIAHLWLQKKVILIADVTMGMQCKSNSHSACHYGYAM